MKLGNKTETPGFGSDKPIPRKPKGKIHHKAFGAPKKPSETSTDWRAKSTRDLGSPDPVLIQSDLEHRYDKKGYRVSKLNSSQKELLRPNPSTLNQNLNLARPKSTNDFPKGDTSLQEPTIPDWFNRQKAAKTKTPDKVYKQECRDIEGF